MGVAGLAVRTVCDREVEIAGQQISAGDKVGLFDCSANRDEAVFTDPGTFDLQRSPNPHLGFGGGDSMSRCGFAVGGLKRRTCAGGEKIAENSPWTHVRRCP
jgi:hypothetical protein